MRVHLHRHRGQLVGRAYTKFVPYDVTPGDLTTYTSANLGNFTMKNRLPRSDLFDADVIKDKRV